MSACGGEEENSGGGEDEEPQPAGGWSRSEESGGRGFFNVSVPWVLDPARLFERTPRGSSPLEQKQRKVGIRLQARQSAEQCHIDPTYQRSGSNRLAASQKSGCVSIKG